ncbi:MAG: response regulator [Planctomycetota bacterium]|nr:MAG: response regulator [Planctomycetota bacterium]
MSVARTILVVDDEAHITHVLAMKLRNAGYNVVTAGDGEEGFELARQTRPDLIVTDMWMPYMTGAQLCEKLRSTPTTHDVPVVVLTARGHAFDPSDLEQPNVRAVLSKPFSPREVLLKIEEVLRSAEEAGQGEAAA